MPSSLLLRLCIALVPLLLITRAQEGNDCYCSFSLNQDGAKIQLLKESTVVLGSLCTDADHGVCSDWCNEKMALFANGSRLTSPHSGVTLGQFLCDRVGDVDPVNGSLQLSVAVCDQEPIDVGPQHPENLCCRQKQYTPC